MVLLKYIIHDDHEIHIKLSKSLLKEVIKRRGYKITSNEREFWKTLVGELDKEFEFATNITIMNIVGCHPGTLGELSDESQHEASVSTPPKGPQEGLKNGHGV